jgi:carbamoylphosphate synthase small subunit
MPTGRIEISAQNHNFAVDPTTLPKVTAKSLSLCLAPPLNPPA